MLQCQCQVRRPCFGNELFVNVYIYTYTHILHICRKLSTKTQSLNLALVLQVHFQECHIALFEKDLFIYVLGPMTKSVYTGARALEIRSLLSAGWKQWLIKLLLDAIYPGTCSNRTGHGLVNTVSEEGTCMGYWLMGLAGWSPTGTALYEAWRISEINTRVDLTLDVSTT